ncbi:hypothetical protein OIU91_02885 [Streptomyces sp. NBC_01456]|uniref:hypothetical protein n=1 Tax=unclassified Streptomyces TaxID=2593676 RepID=UPI002E300FCD|nr:MULTISPECIES: hypothetical protein [unclassified Streptomyces]
MTDTNHVTDASRQIPALIPTVGPGWTELLDQLHRDLSALDPAYRIEEFGTQLGRLRITVTDRFEAGEFDGEYADRAAALTDTAETASEQTCEACGSSGRIRFRGDGTWMRMQSLCDDCRNLGVFPYTSFDNVPNVPH